MENSQDSIENELKQQLQDNIRLKKYLIDNISILIKISVVITQAYAEGHKVLIMGNGGSAADAQHIAGEMVGKFYLHRSSLPALALTSNSGILTAIANDYSYEDVFKRQVQALTKPGDIVIGISTSGQSPNVISAIKEAKHLGAITVSFSGQNGILQTNVDYALVIPSIDTPRIQETYMAAGHIICYLVEKLLFGRGQNEAETTYIGNNIGLHYGTV